jgi:hypothetical protein
MKSVGLYVYGQTKTHNDWYNGIHILHMENLMQRNKTNSLVTEHEYSTLLTTKPDKAHYREALRSAFYPHTLTSYDPLKLEQDVI